MSFQGPVDTAPKPYYQLATPNGSVSAPTTKLAMLYPMKIHTGQGARVTGPSGNTHIGELIAPSTFIYFTQAGTDVNTGWNLMVKDGMKQQFGADTLAWETVNTMEFQTINHGVEPKANALKCGACHSALASSGGGPVRVDLKKLGYGLRTGTSIITAGRVLDGTTNTVCRQCHGSESSGFTSVHSRHVGEKRYDCSACHNFARPEQGLKTTR